MDERQALEAVLALLGERRLHDGVEPIASVDQRGHAFEIVLRWPGEPPSIFVVARDGTIAVIVDGPSTRR